MKSQKCYCISVFSAVIAVSVAAVSSVCGGTLSPYVTDAETLHLWHFDGSATPALDSAGSEPLTLNGGAALGQTAFSGFGTALDLSPVYGDDNRADGSQDIAPSNLVTQVDTGAFTFEALVKPEVALGGTSGSMQIISMEDEDGSGKRSFQFRIGSNGKLKLVNIVGGSPADVDIPTNGANAYVAGEWFHVAATYTGEAGVSGNFKYYWTRLAEGVTRANLIKLATMHTDLINVGDFCVGNDARDASSESFVGDMDEVRISQSVRSFDEFVFGNTYTNRLLLQDTFDSVQSGLNSNLATRQSGKLAETEYSSVGGGSFTNLADEIYFDNTSVDVASLAISPDVDLAAGDAGAAVNGHGFIVDFDVNPIANSNDTGSSFDWFAFSFGHTATSRVAPNTTLVNRSNADFGILLRDNGQFSIFDNGSSRSPSDQIFDEFPVGTKMYNVRLVVLSASPASGSGTVSLFINGTQIDLTDGAGLDYAFTWDGDGSNYITLESRNNCAILNNLRIEAATPLVLPGTLILVQ